MPFDFLDQVPPDSLEDWEKEVLDVVRAALVAKRPTRIDEKSASVRLSKARPMKTRYIEIVLPHQDETTASLEIVRNAYEIHIDTHFGTFGWEGDELSLVEDFLAAAIEGTLEYETVYQDGRLRHARAWRLDEGNRQLLGEMLGRRQKSSWRDAVTTHPPGFL